MNTCLGNCGASVILMRGLCRGCYRKIAAAIQMGKTTWEQLEAEGKAAPKKVSNFGRRQLEGGSK